MMVSKNVENDITAKIAFDGGYDPCTAYSMNASFWNQTVGNDTSFWNQTVGNVA
jgi:hypothetical protein